MLQSDSSNSASMKWLKSISLVNSRSWQKILKGVDCHTSQSADIRAGMECCPSYTRGTSSLEKYKTKKRLQNIQRFLDVLQHKRCSGFTLLSSGTDCCPPWTHFQVEGLYVAAMLLLNFFSPLVRRI